jgi:hypothetical protein
MAFSNDEIAAIRKFADWLSDGNWLDGYSEGVTGCDNDGIIVTEFTCESDYCGGCSREQTTTFIPWIALTNPEEFQRQQDERERERKLQQAAEQRLWQARREAEERAALAALKAKYEPQ